MVIAFNALEDADTVRKIVIFAFAFLIGCIFSFVFFKFEKITSIAASMPTPEI